MLFAIVNSEKVEAIPKTTGTCPLCEKVVFSKCGEIKIWHWAHQNECCDSWYEPETEWHKNWKLIFGKDFCEKVIIKDGVKHIADIYTRDKVVIELQNSPIQKQIIRKREIFYGDRMLWVINGMDFKHNFHLTSRYFDNLEEFNRRHDYIDTPQGAVDKSTGEIVSVPIKKFNFSWSRFRKSWSDVQRNVFIDFGDQNLFWVTSGIGTGAGIGKQISKEFFLKKYGGNTELLQTLIEKKHDRNR